MLISKFFIRGAIQVSIIVCPQTQQKKKAIPIRKIYNGKNRFENTVISQSAIKNSREPWLLKRLSILSINGFFPIQCPERFSFSYFFFLGEKLEYRYKHKAHVQCPVKISFTYKCKRFLIVQLISYAATSTFSTAVARIPQLDLTRSLV